MGKALILNQILSTYSLRKCIWDQSGEFLLTIQNPNHVMHIDGKEIGTNFQFWVISSCLILSLLLLLLTDKHIDDTWE